MSECECITTGYEVPLRGLKFDLDKDAIRQIVQEIVGSGGGGEAQISFVVGQEFETNLTAPNGKPIFRKTYALPTGVTVDSTVRTTTLEENFGQTKSFVGIDSRCSFAGHANGGAVPIGYSGGTSTRYLIVSSSVSHLNFIYQTSATASTITSGCVTVLYTYK